MNAIPTRYNGVQFRSRLEARWAAMFDLLQWKWEYEPIDLDGYIPDFLVTFHDQLSSFLVEVKPLIWTRPLSRAAAVEPFSGARRKIVDSGWNGESWIAGASLIPPIDPLNKSRAIGLGWNGSGPRTASPWSCWRCAKCILLWPHSEYSCCHCGFLAKGGEKRPPGTSQLDTQQIWREAGNRVQWRAQGVS